MRPYRVVSSIESDVAETPRRHRGRAVAIVLATVGLHAAVLGVAFASRAPEPVAPRTQTVRVLAGQVDPMTGDFQVAGLRDARIATK